ncbi:MAG: transketolase, partial [Hyphomicrobiales bacterium]
QLEEDLSGKPETLELIAQFDDASLADLMTNLAGHCMETLLKASLEPRDEKPVCFIAYTVKGKDLPLAGHKDNHAGLMTPAQMASFRKSCGVAEGEEWDRYAGLSCDRTAVEAAV